MDKDTFAAALRAFTKRRPFSPFVVELFSGDRLFDPHPEALTFRSTLLYFIDPKNQARLFQAESVCQLLENPLAPET
jgi:hypothetical protein